MSRSIFARASSARRRLISNCAAHYTSAATGLLQLPRAMRLGPVRHGLPHRSQGTRSLCQCRARLCYSHCPLLELQLWLSLLLR
jgi:hypothetical protein